jgi:DNA-binding response OmpR family regulator
MNKILFAEDESRIRILVEDFLQDEGFEVISVKDGEDAIEYFYDHQDVKLVITDIMMPKMDGFELVRSIREISKVPVLMLTAKTDETDELKGFTLGVDDYIRKPFSPTILTARVKALFERVYGTNNEFIKGEFVFKLNERLVTYKGSIIELSQTEFDLLYYLAENEGIALSREQILFKVWGFDYEGTDRTVDTHMNRLRNKLGIESDCIKTIRGYGYKFEVSL